MTTTKRNRAARRQAPAIENVTNDAPRLIGEGGEAIDVGDCYPQGDLYFVRLHARPRTAKPRGNRQIAEGDTQGSRHVCTVGRVYDADAAEVQRMISAANGVQVGAEYIGPIVTTDDSGKAVVEHPEHGDHHYAGQIVLGTVFQRSLDAEEREARVAD